MEGRAGQGAHQLFADALRQTWSGAVENDGFNRLVLSAGLSAREIVILRAYCKVLRQAGSSFSQAYMEDTLNAHPSSPGCWCDLFQAQFDPAQAESGDGAAAESISAKIDGRARAGGESR